MKKNVVLGIDPGIANTGLAIVACESSRYQLLASRLIKTSSSDAECLRLLDIYRAVSEMLDNHKPALVAAERIFHNRNVSSSITTGKVLGVVLLAAAERFVSVHEFTPQEIKSCSGFGGEANKDRIKKSASRIFGVSLKSHHTADAAFAGLAGLLKLRSLRCENRGRGVHRTIVGV